MLKKKKVSIPLALGFAALLLALGVVVFAKTRVEPVVLDVVRMSSDDGYSPSGAEGGISEPAALPAKAGEGPLALESGPGDRPGEHAEHSVRLKAGAVDDNESFGDYLDYRAGYSGQSALDLDVEERHVIVVSDEDGRRVGGARVAVDYGGETVFEGVTFADGRTLFMPNSLGADLPAVEEVTVRVTSGGQSGAEVFALGEGSEGVWRVELSGGWEPVEPIELDVVYLVDATGSMADEIRILKSTLSEVAGEIEREVDDVSLRMGMVAYRDRDDDFVVRRYELTDDVGRLRRDVNDLAAAGGGDRPESVNEGLHNAVRKMDWRGDHAIKLVFLVGDAGPQLFYEQDYPYDETLRDALGAGIKVHAVATSGLDEFGEYVFRQLAQYTMGKFIFLVYGGQTTHDVGQFAEQNLDQLIVDLVLEEISELRDE